MNMVNNLTNRALHFILLVSLFAQASFSIVNANPLFPNGKVTAYLDDGRGWTEISRNELQKSQEFLCENHLCYFHGKFGALRMNPNVDIALLPEADRSYDKKYWRFPEPTDVVRFIDKSYKHVRHDRMGTVQIDDRFFFQGKLYEVISDTKSPTGVSISYTGVVLSRVVKTFKHPSNILAELTIYDINGQESIITGTRDHPFFVPAVNKYIPMGNLAINTVLETDDGSLATVKNVKNLYGESTVYNLEVEGTNNFYVTSPSGGPVVNVHNTCECDEVLGAPKRRAKSKQKKVQTPKLKDSDSGPKIADKIQPSVPKNWGKNEIENAIEDYKVSIKSRKSEADYFESIGGGSKWGRKSHMERIAEEEKFLRKLIKKLTDMNM